MSTARQITTSVEVSPARRAKLARLEANRAPALRMADRIIATAAARPEAPRGLTRGQRRRQALALPRLASDVAIEPVARVLDDPYAPGEKLGGTVNRRVDVLETERSRGPVNGISQAAFLTGREIQATFERAELSGGSNWSGGDRVDAELAKEKRIIRNVDTARAINAEMKRLTGEVGDIGARFLRDILTGSNYRQHIERRGGAPTDRNIASVASRFRWLLEEIADKRAAAGKRQPAPDDHFATDWLRAEEVRRLALQAQG